MDSTARGGDSQARFQAVMMKWSQRRARGEDPEKETGPAHLGAL